MMGPTNACAQFWNPLNAPLPHSRFYNPRAARTSPHYPHGYGVARAIEHSYSRGWREVGCPVSIEGGFVAKRFVTNFGSGDRFRENIWGEEGRFMNGIQWGVAVMPTAPCGVGLRTGVFYEMYFADGGSNADGEGYDHFTEHDIYVPVQLNYAIPVTPHVDINLSTGVGFNCALAGVYHGWGRYGHHDYQHYGNDNAPDRINAMWEVGANVNVRRFKIGFDYGLGLNDQEFYDHARTRQNKFSITAGVVF